MRLITAVSLNPSIDQTLYFNRFALGATNRVADSREDVSGKGVNVALSAANLGARAVCIGFMRSGQRAWFDRIFEAAGVAHRCAEMPGDVRVNRKLIDRSSGVATEINSAGPPVGKNDIARMIALVKESARDGIMVFCGSLPPGCPDDLYKTLIGIASDAGCRCALDADRAYLAEGVRAAPFLIKPNRAELAALSGRKVESVQDARCAAESLSAAHGIELVLTSLGQDGAVLTEAGNAWFLPAPDVPVASTVGAGDAMLAGFLAALDAGSGSVEAFRWSVAAAAASVMTEGTQPVLRPTAERLLNDIKPVLI